MVTKSYSLDELVGVKQKNTKEIMNLPNVIGIAVAEVNSKPVIVVYLSKKDATTSSKVDKLLGEAPHQCKVTRSINALQTKEQREQKLAEIRKGMAEYDQHKNDPYAYDQREITEVRDFEGSARENIGFLLEEVDRLSAEAADASRLRGLLKQTGGSVEDLIRAADHGPNGLYAQMYRDKDEKPPKK